METMLKVRIWKLKVRSSRYVLSMLFMLFATNLFAQSLEEYYKIAAENNPGLQAKYKNYELALQKINQQQALDDPRFSMGYFISPIETRTGPQRARFSLTQLFPWFGTLKAKGNAAALYAEASFQLFIAARNQLFSQVAKAYYPIQELTALQAIEEENIIRLKTFKKVVIQEIENGKKDMVDFYQVDLKLKAAETELQILSDKRSSLQADFYSLLNFSIQDSALEIAPLDRQLNSDVIDASLNFELHPEVEQYNLKSSAAEAEWKAAKKQALPQIGLGMDYYIVEKRSVAGISDNGQDAFMPVLSLSIPIYRKKYRAYIESAELKKEVFELEKREQLNQFYRQHARLIFEMKEQLALTALYNTQIQTAKQSLNLLQAAYSNATKEVEDVLLMQDQLLNYQKEKIASITKYQLLSADLNYLNTKTEKP